jgi:hypothetical protein
MTPAIDASAASGDARAPGSAKPAPELERWSQSLRRRHAVAAAAARGAAFD